MGRNLLSGIIALVLLLPTLAFAQGRAFTFDATDVDATAALEGKITDYEIVRLDVAGLYAAWNDTPGLLDFDLAGTAGTVSLHLAPWELRTADYQVTLNGDARTPRPTALHSPVYRGNVTGGGEAIVTFDRQFILGHYEVNGRRMALEPLWRLQDGADRDLYVLYDETKAVTGGTDVCETDVSGLVAEKPTGDPTKKSLVGGCLGVDIALVADTELYADFNDVASVENFMLGVLADVRTVYDDEFADEIQYLVTSTTIYTNTNIDPYSNTTNASLLIDDFRVYSSNNPSSIPGDYDVASLWTGRDFIGGTIGIAYVPGICGSGRYNVLENFSSSSIQLRNVWAHELGHNFNCPHDPSGPGAPVHIMFPSVSSVSTWSATSVSIIQDYYASLTCLETCAPPVAAPEKVYTNIAAGTANYFFDETPVTIETRQWTFPGGTPATSTEVAPEVVFEQPGNYVATLTVTNQSGTSTSQVPITVAEEGGMEVLFREDFEDQDLRVSFINPQNDILEWELFTTDGTLGNSSARIDNGTIDRRFTSDFMQSPAIDIDGVEDPKLSLEYAYVRYNFTFRDKMRVSIIQNGVKTEVFFGDELGQGTFATGPDWVGQFGLFLPEDEDDWCFSSPGCIEVDLAPFQGGGDIIVEVENIAGYGQPLFVDNIAVTGIQSLALPVEWLTFAAAPTGKEIGLNWTVNQDAENAGFHVERTDDNQRGWATIGEVAARAGAEENAAYTFSDLTAALGTDYQYRIRQTDLDGTESYSEIRTARLNGAAVAGLSVFPNPTSGNVVLSIPAGDDVPYTLFDATGRSLRQGNFVGGRAELNLTELPAGVYTVRTPVGTTRVVRK
ncbi:M12 family metallo-peptidase [Lewinella sp. 4G2]|uniref:M12 family metallo-peptidase n=1 Tax=Lewinella sp. 4G2 TaxID=1803372 RepID=UPI0007B4840B|nr:M12 family metallo-peptidase [Lewinella sp. 4G2]OAV43815.1 hypothetical protein A3850_004565 [Lewinella sp. 4G2]